MNDKNCNDCYTINELTAKGNNIGMLNLFCACCKSCGKRAYTKNQSQYEMLQKEVVKKNEIN